MRILGLSFGFHDAGACMLNGTKIEFAGQFQNVTAKLKMIPG